MEELPSLPPIHSTPRLFCLGAGLVMHHHIKLALPSRSAGCDLVPHNVTCSKGGCKGTTHCTSCRFSFIYPFYTMYQVGFVVDSCVSNSVSVILYRYFYLRRWEGPRETMK